MLPVLRRCHPIIDTSVRGRRGEWRTPLVPGGRVLPPGASLSATLVVALAASPFHVVVEVCGHRVDRFVEYSVQPALRARYLASSFALLH